MTKELDSAPRHLVWESDRATRLTRHSEISTQSVPVSSDGRYIYMLLSNGRVVYVGQTITHPAIRIADHKKSKQFDSYYFECVEDCDSLSEIEALYVMTLKPKYNTSIPNRSGFASKKTVMKSFGITALEMRSMSKSGCISPVEYIESIGPIYAISEVQESINNIRGNKNA